MHLYGHKGLVIQFSQKTLHLKKSMSCAVLQVYWTCCFITMDYFRAYFILDASAHNGQLKEALAIYKRVFNSNLQIQ